MAGTLLCVGVVACAATLSLSLVTAGSAAAFSQNLAGVADAAALAAADAASGAVEGEPCARAAQIAATSAARIAACDRDELVVTVTVTGAFGWLTATASARAGPPR
ncbi:helicase [Microbacterium sp. zg.B48]|uniref:helicase n=1 Tax=unclassified Microbacterium TaxID=2609290 RepID=UPI00214ACE55|nr:MULTISPECIES: helicase [unclassified Microbacterium]MCR2762610.1 helicase [Microbacterium sp. zg.B48]MCR2810780.1 helicase [Microbacterium sp. zg.B185]WIM18312.1 helicase [Microbacterium sp. zg-B185]